MSTFIINNYYELIASQLSVEITSDLVYAEDLVIDLAKRFDINPIGRHLFGLYHQNNRIWLSNNQSLNEWHESKVFDFRLRFRPKHINSLKFVSNRSVDYKTFYYYFHQIRHDFINGKYDQSLKNRIYGLAVTDMIREALGTDISNADKLIEEFSNFLPKSFPKPTFFNPKDKIKESFYKGLNSAQQQKEEIVYQEFIKQFITSLCPNYGIEIYDVMFDNRFANRQHLLAVKVKYIHFSDTNEANGIVCQYINDSKSEWTKFCAITDIGFISLDSKTKTVEISRTNGVPFRFTFKHDLDMKSFVSLLDGYYRLSVKWSFNICKDISSPSLAKLRKLKTHGPIDYEFALNKLKEKSNDITGAYILRESTSKYDEYKVDVFVRHEMYETFKLIQINGTKKRLFVESINQYFDSFSEFIKNFSFIYCETKINLSHCITPSEHDLPLSLLLCRLKSKENVSESDVQQLGPLVISTQSLKISNTTLTNNSRYGVRLANLQNKQFIVKEVKSAELTEEFLKTVSQWTHLRNDTIVICRGITLFSPLSILLEYLPIGPLDAFLTTNRQNLKTVDLIETISYLSRALWYLYENNVVHGHIRCHNLLVSEYSPNKYLKVKLSDPISDNDINLERVWLPTEYLSPSKYSFKRLTHSVDVWAFGTTVWQIFSYGIKPNCEDVFELIKPIDCPNEIWTLIGECWTIDSEARKQPHSIYRDISQIFYEVFNTQRNDYYSKPVFEDQKPMKVNQKLLKSFSKYKPNSFFGSSFSLSSGSIVSNQSVSTYLTNSIKGNETIGSDVCLMSDHNGYDQSNSQSNEPWIIELSQLKLGKVIGTGCYGEVLKATLTLCAGLKEELVAVKRIKAVPTDSQLRDMIREIEIMKKLSHKNIVEIKGFVEDTSEPQTMLVMEFVELGSLVSYLRLKSNIESQKLSIPLVDFASDVNLGMEYLESKCIVHRDLAARNILVASENHVKISDFGLAQFIGPNNDYYTIKTNRELPLRWYAPESLKYGRFSHKSDIWSFGIVLWEMYSYGENPQFADNISDSNLLQTLEKGIRLPLPKGCPHQAFQIMRDCWQIDSQLRPTFSQLKASIKEIPQELIHKWLP